MYIFFVCNKIWGVTYSVMSVILGSTLSWRRWGIYQDRVGRETFIVQKLVQIFKKEGPYEDEHE